MAPPCAGGFSRSDALDESRAKATSEAMAIFAEAEEFLAAERLEDAEQAASEAQALLRKLGEGRAAVDSLRLVLAARNARDDVIGAERLALDSLERFEESGDRRGEAAMLLTLTELGRDQRGSAAYRDVLAAGTEAQAVFQDLGDKEMVAAVLIALGTLYRDHGKATNLMQASNGALALYQALHDKKGQGQALHGVAVAYGLQKKYSQALRTSMAARTIFQELGAVRLEARELSLLAQWHQSLKDYSQMLRHAQESMEMFGKTRAMRQEAEAMGLAVEAHALLGQDAQGQTVAEEALQRYGKANHEQGQTIALRCLISCHVARGELDLALEHAEEALELIRAGGDLRAEAATLQTVAGIQLDRTSLDEALDTADTAIGLLQDVGDEAGEASLRLHSLAFIHAAREEHGLALTAANEARSIYKELGDRHGLGSAMLTIGRLHQLSGSLEESEKWLNESKATFEELDDATLVLQVLQALVSVFMEAAKLEEAAQAAYAGHALSQRENDKTQEINMLLLIVQAQLAVLRKLDNGGSQVPSREFDSVWSKADRAASTARKVSATVDDKGLSAHTLLLHSEVSLVNGRLRDALNGVQEASALYTELGYKSGEGYAAVLKAQTLKFSGRPQDALLSAERGFQLGRELGDALLQASASQVIDGIRGPAPLRQSALPQPALPQQFIAEEKFGAAAAEEAAAAVSAASATIVEEKPKGLDAVIVNDMLNSMLREMMGMDVESDTPFMDAGVDSLMSIEFRSQVNGQFTGLSLSNTLTFDYPTVRELTSHIVEKSLE